MKELCLMGFGGFPGVWVWESFPKVCAMLSNERERHVHCTLHQVILIYIYYLLVS